MSASSKLILDLEKERNAISAEMAEVRRTIVTLTKENAEREKRFKKIEQQIASLKKRGGKVTVCDHAVVRYLERIGGVDIESAKATILPGSIEANVAVLGDGIYAVPADGDRPAFKTVIRGGVVVTVFGIEDKRKQ